MIQSFLLVTRDVPVIQAVGLSRFSLKKWFLNEGDPLADGETGRHPCQVERVPIATASWIVSDELSELVEPLLPKRKRRFRLVGPAQRDRLGGTCGPSCGTILGHVRLRRTCRHTNAVAMQSALTMANTIPTAPSKRSRLPISRMAPAIIQPPNVTHGRGSGDVEARGMITYPDLVVLMSTSGCL